jgi:hypothetical protein
VDAEVVPRHLAGYDELRAALTAWRTPEAGSDTRAWLVSGAFSLALLAGGYGSTTAPLVPWALLAGLAVWTMGPYAIVALWRMRGVEARSRRPLYFVIACMMSAPLFRLCVELSNR